MNWIELNKHYFWIQSSLKWWWLSQMQFISFSVWIYLLLRIIIHCWYFQFIGFYICFQFEYLYYFYFWIEINLNYFFTLILNVNWKVNKHYFWIQITFEYYPPNVIHFLSCWKVSCVEEYSLLWISILIHIVPFQTWISI